MAVLDDLLGRADVYTGMAGLVCLIGTLALARFVNRPVTSGTETDQTIQLLASACIGGCTIWTTQALGFAGRFPVAPHASAAGSFIQSLVVAFALSAIAISLARSSRTAATPELGGLVFGACSWMTLLAAMAANSATHLSSPGLMAHLCGGAWVIAFSMLGMRQLARGKTAYRHLSAAGFVTIGNLGLLLIVAAPLAGLTATGITGNEPGPAGSGASLEILAVVLVLLASIGISYSFESTRQSLEAAALERAAFEDPITGLANRSHLETLLETELGEAAEIGTRSAVIYLNLSRFSEVRDLYGLSGGDKILAQFAATLSASLHPDEYICRFGEDSFVAVKKVIGSDQDARDFAERLRAASASPARHEAQPVQLRANIGLALCPEDGWDMKSLLHRASLAAKQAHQNGPNQLRTFNPGLEEADRRQSGLVTDLKEALDTGQLHLVFQAHMRTRDRSITGYEALVRWHHPTAGIINACNFIPIAEKSGLIIEIGEWGLREACQRAANWAPDLTVSINASPIQLARPEYPALVEQILKETRLPAERVEIELTETSTIEDPAWVLASVRKLRDLGIRIVMDDFGTGYSSLNTLQEFPFDKIKIDRVFTSSVETDPRSRAIIRSAVLLGHSFKIPVVAEGVENEVQFRFVKEAGCTEVQGFHFGQAVQADELEEVEPQAPLSLVSGRAPRVRPAV